MTFLDDSLAPLLGLLSLAIGVAVYVWTALALAAMFRKMGEEPWKAWVPFLNHATVLRWGGFNPWLVLIALVPVLGGFALWVLLTVAAHRLNPGFGYGSEMTVLAALLFVVWASIHGFGPSRWLGARAPGAVAPEPAVPVAPAEPTVADTDPARPSSAFAPDEAPATEPAPVWRPPTGPVPVLRTESPQPAGELPPWGRSAPVAADAPDDAAWPSEVDEVSAVHPSPFPPSAATARPYVPAPVTRGDGPIAFVPGRKSAVPREPGDAPVTRVPPAGPAAPPEPWAPARSAEYDPDAFPEMSGEVSAVVGSPAAGSPLSARRSVSAQQRPYDLDDDDDPEQTVIARRQRPGWSLTVAGRTVPLVAEVVILGRQPAPDPAYPRAQLVVVEDRTRTVSKTHARLELKPDGWQVTDLHSTNGVLLPTLMGTEEEIGPGSPVPAGDRFRLGDAQITLARTDR